jgi:hypothetical protein
MKPKPATRVARNGHMGNARLSVRDSYWIASSTSATPHHASRIRNTHAIVAASSLMISAARCARGPSASSVSSTTVALR